MIEFDNTIIIGRSLPVVFQFVSNLENIPKWNYFVLQVRKTSAGPLAVGAEYHQTRKTDQQRIKITQFDPPRALTVVSVPPSRPKFERSLHFSGDDEATEIADSWKLEVGVPPLLSPLARARVSSAVRENLGKLKELLESGSTVLQDRRSISI